MPHTTLGRLCCRFGIGSIVAFGAFFGLVAAGQRGEDDFFSNPRLATAILLAAGMAIAGAATGIGAIVGQRERAWTVSITVVFGLLVAFFAAGEVMFPH